jgi:hypothetical protein
MNADKQQVLGYRKRNISIGGFSSPDYHLCSQADIMSSTELQPFGIAFGFSGSSRFVEMFEFNFHSIVTDYETTERTDPAFFQFRIQCLKFIAWAGTMRAAWAMACASGSLLTESHLQLQLFDISAPLLKLVKEAARSIDDVRSLKEKYESFEINEPSDGESAKLRSALNLYRSVADRISRSQSSLQGRKHRTRVQMHQCPLC